MDKKIENLLNLINDNPDFPIIPEVSSEAVPSDEYSYWFAEWGNARVDEYVEYSMYGEDRFIFKDDIETITEHMINTEYENEELTEEQALERAEKLEWKKAIFVRINEY